jgi:hypothetical protein
MYRTNGAGNGSTQGLAGSTSNQRHQFNDNSRAERCLFRLDRWNKTEQLSWWN